MRNNAIVGTEADPVFSHVGGPWHGNHEPGFCSWLQGGGFHGRAPARQESSLLIKQQNDRGEVIHFAAARRIANNSANRQMVVLAFVVERQELQDLIGRHRWRRSRLVRRCAISRHPDK